MRIIGDNRLNAAQLSSTNENLNYPLTNVIHEYLTKVYRSSINEDDITIEFNQDESIDCVVIGYHNLADITVKMYNIVDTLLDTQVLDVTDTMHYFTQVDDVAYIVLEIDSDAAYCEIGSVWAGLKISMPSASFAFKETIGDRSAYSKTEGGQISGRKIAKLKGYNFSIPYASITEIRAIEIIIQDLQKVKNFWFDLFEDSHDTYEPIFCNITQISQATKLRGLAYNFTFSVEESR